MDAVEQQLWFLLDQQQERDLTQQERIWIIANFPEYESLLFAE